MRSEQCARRWPRSGAFARIERHHCLHDLLDTRPSGRPLLRFGYNAIRQESLAYTLLDAAATVNPLLPGLRCENGRIVQRDGWVSPSGDPVPLDSVVLIGELHQCAIVSIVDKGTSVSSSCTTRSTESISPYAAETGGIPWTARAESRSQRRGAGLPGVDRHSRSRHVTAAGPRVRDCLGCPTDHRRSRAYCRRSTERIRFSDLSRHATESSRSPLYVG